MKWKIWNALNQTLRSKEGLFLNAGNKLSSRHVICCLSSFKRQAECSGEWRASPGICFNNCFAVVFVCFSYFPIHPADHFQSPFTQKINILFNLNQEDRRPVQWQLRTSHLGNCIKFVICLWNKALGLCFLWMYFSQDRGAAVSSSCWTQHTTIGGHFLYSNCWSQSPEKLRT